MAKSLLPQRPQALVKTLTTWYEANLRDLPWRKNRDPYRIWISEVMLQQTTTRAVIPYYERFMERFPQLKDLAMATEAELFPYWAGLGYYSRARNLLKAAQALSEMGRFPEQAGELIKLPGFGAYTACAVASQAFKEPVGVVDGNVIRVLSRVTGQGFEWWQSAPKKVLQSLADELAAAAEDAGELNQAVMELGATICTPKNPSCFLCPWQRDCVALKENKTSVLPLRKAKRESELWVWEPSLLIHKKKVALLPNDYAPFLKNQWFFPGQAKRIKSPPKDFDFIHGITHHKIYVRIQKESVDKPLREYKWVKPQDLQQVNPASLLKKAMIKGDLL